MSFTFEEEPAVQGPAVEASALRDLPLRVWAEIGRARMPAAAVVGMAPGAIVELDHHPADPAEIYVNGRYFGHGRLLLVDGEWAVRIESIELAGPDLADPPSES